MMMEVGRIEECGDWHYALAVLSDNACGVGGCDAASVTGSATSGERGTSLLETESAGDSLSESLLDSKSGLWPGPDSMRRHYE